MKKEYSNWYLALIHLSIAVFAMPLLFFLVYGLFSPLLGVAVFESEMWFAEEVLYITALWLGVMYSSNILPKKYTIPDATKLTHLSAFYFGVLSIIFWLYALVTTEFDMMWFLLNVVLFVAELALFYFFTKRYMKSS